MIYTTYLANIKKIPDNARKIIIMRYMPASLKDPKYNVEWEPSLGPDDILFSKYKKDEISFIEFREKYMDQLELNKQTACTIDKLIKEIEDNPEEDIYLICCEKNNLECHRRFLLRYIEDKLIIKNLNYLIGGERKEW